MARITSRKATEYLRHLENLSDHTDDICKMAVYEGAKVVADAIHQSIDEITVHSLPEWKKYYYLSDKARASGEMLDGVTKEQAQGLKDGLGVAVMEYKGKEWNTKIGFDGYNSIKTEKYPNGQPNALIARSVESGSLVRNKTPFIAPAVEKIKKTAEDKMAVTVQQQIAALTKE